MEKIKSFLCFLIIFLFLTNSTGFSKSTEESDLIMIRAMMYKVQVGDIEISYSNGEQVVQSFGKRPRTYPEKRDWLCYKTYGS